MTTKLILNLSATIFSITNCYSTYNNYLINKETYINDIVLDSIEFTYLNYVKDIKKSEWTNETKCKALITAKDYFNNNCIYKNNVSNIKLNRLIEYRLLEIKTLKKS